LLSGYGEMVS